MEVANKPLALAAGYLASCAAACGCTRVSTARSAPQVPPACRRSPDSKACPAACRSSSRCTRSLDCVPGKLPRASRLDEQGPCAQLAQPTPDPAGRELRAVVRADTLGYLREVTPYGLTPGFLIRDRDSKYGHEFTRVAKASSTEVLKTPTALQRPTRSANGSWGA